MQSKYALLLLASGSVVSASGCAHKAGHEHHESRGGEHHSHAKGGGREEAEEGDDAEEKHVALADLPAGVRAAAMKAAPEFVLEEASVETENGHLVYTLEGKSGGSAYEFEIDADGRVLESHAIRSDDDEDGDHEEDDEEEDERDEARPTPRAH